ncbi:MAG: tRNA (adenosine(37)-N6)-threonylcarbamoyltransferase complex transferase subunit TsaD [Candidatus Paceibacterota bacterium]
MKILSIETSCDETAVSLVEATGDFPNAKYQILGNALFSQIDIHREYGGVFPSVAKREHAKTLVPMLKKSQNANLKSQNYSEEVKNDVRVLLEREVGMYEELIEYVENYEKPAIDLIAVTAGPGLEPTLWVGINFAKALALLWNVPVVPVNHMEGHILASIFKTNDDKSGNTLHSNGGLADLQFPSLALLISGGHTELIKMNDWPLDVARSKQHYEKIGQTRDDAVGEAFDKVARLLGLPYPGGPEISRAAGEARSANLPEFHKLPRPMLDSDDLDFSFSGLKTAVRYAIEGKELSEEDKQAVARDFEDAVVEVLLKKAERAVNKYDIRSLILGGGVSANRQIRDTFASFFASEHPELNLYLPDLKLSTDNSIMIALAGHARSSKALAPTIEALSPLVASGNRSLSEE